jgi:hypothetical protein
MSTPDIVIGHGSGMGFIVIVKIPQGVTKIGLITSS